MIAMPPDIISICLMNNMMPAFDQLANCCKLVIDHVRLYTELSNEAADFRSVVNGHVSDIGANGLIN